MSAKVPFSVFVCALLCSVGCFFSLNFVLRVSLNLGKFAGFVYIAELKLWNVVHNLGTGIRYEIRSWNIEVKCTMDYHFLRLFGYFGGLIV